MNRFLAGILIFSWIQAASADFANEYNNGIYFYKRAEYELAAKSFEKTLARYPGDARADAVLYWCGQSYEQLGRFSDAVKLYKTLARDFPQSTYRNDALYTAGTAASNDQSYSEAIALFSELLRDPSADPKQILDCRIKIAETYLKEGDDPHAESALRELLDIPQLPPDRRQVAEFRLRQLWMRTGRSAEGIAAFSRTPKNTELSQAEDFLYRGDAAFTGGKFGEGRTWYEQVYRKTDIPPELRAQAAYGIARASQALGDPAKAQALFKEAFDEKGALPDIRGGAALQLAYLYRNSGDAGEAEKMAAAGARIIESSHLERLKDDLVYFRAESAFLRKKYQESLDQLSRMSESGYRVNRLTGRALFELNRPDEATTYIERAAVQAPDDDARNLCLYDLAQNQVTAKQYDPALTTMDRIQHASAALDAKLKPLHADALFALGRFQEAASEYAALGNETKDAPSSRRYRYLSVLSGFKDRNFSWSEKVLSDLAAIGGIPEGEGEDPAAFLEAAIELDKAIDFAAPGKENLLQGQIDSVLNRVPHPRLYAFVLDRLSSKEWFNILPRYSQEILRTYTPADEVYGRAAYYELQAYEKQGDRPASSKALKNLSRWAAVPGHAQSPMAEEAEYLRATFAREIGDRPGAKEAYGSYLRKFPSGSHAHEALFRLGNLFMEDHQPDDAEQAYQRLIDGKSPAEIRSDPDLSAAANSLASIRIRQNRPADAAALLEPLSSGDSFKDDPDYHYKVGIADLQAGKLQESLPHFRTIIESSAASSEMRDSAADALFSSLHRLRQFGSLESDYRRYAGRIRNRAVLSRAKYFVGMSIFQAERFAEAMDFFAGVQEPRGSDMAIEAGVRLADCEYYLKRYDAALDHYNKITKTYPETRWAQESYYALQLCKIKLGLAGDPLGGYERFLQQNPAAPQAPLVAFEAAKLYVEAEDLDAAERMLDFYEKKGSQTMMEEVIRMRMDISKKRGQHEKFVALAKTHRKTYGFDPIVAVDAAVAATKAGIAYDVFDLSSRTEIADMTKAIETIFSSSGAKPKTFPTDERFYDRGSKIVDADHTLQCSVKRVIFTPDRVLLVVESRAVGFLSDVSRIRIKNVSSMGEDVNQMNGGFLTGLQLGEEFALGHNATRLFVISMLRDYWSTDVKINLDVDFGGRDLLLYCSIKGMKN